MWQVKTSCLLATDFSHRKNIPPNEEIQIPSSLLDFTHKSFLLLVLVLHSQSITMSTGKAKKYKLFSSAADSGERPPCAFFFSDKGCRNGDNCKFSHERASSEKKSDVIPFDSGSVVSSESEQSTGDHGKGKMDVDENPFAEPTRSSGQKRKNRRGANNDSPFPTPKSAKEATPKPSESASIKKEDDEHPQKKKAKKEPKKKESGKSKAPDFRSLDLPIADWALASASDHAKASPDDDVSEEEKEETNKAPEKQKYNIQDPASLPKPKNHEFGKKFLKAVTKTQENSKFQGDFNYERDMAGEESKWFQARPYGDWCKNNPQVIAMDCEMCETTNPETKEKNHSALCRVSIVDAGTDEVLLNTLVKPEWPVTDYRTFINGITEESLKGVEFTVEHAQEFMKALCSEETVVVGHAVQNDLKVLKMEHYCVADSAFLFKAADSETATVSLKDLSFSVMKKEMPKTHDSVNDARAALRCVEHYVEKNGKVEKVIRRQHESRMAAQSSLFVHRIPRHVTAKHIADMISSTTKVIADEVDDVEFGGGPSGKTTIKFASGGHADLAFATLSGKGEEDASGKLQKRVYLRGGEYIRIRKNFAERKFDRRNSKGEKSDKSPARGDKK